MEDGSSPATKQDIEGILQAIREVSQRVEAVGTKLGSLGTNLEGLGTKLGSLETKLEGLEIEFSQRIEAVETKLLGAFFSYQEYDRIENRKFRADLSNISAASDLRFDNLESRISALEKKILTNPIQPPQQ